MKRLLVIYGMCHSGRYWEEEEVGIRKGHSHKEYFLHSWISLEKCLQKIYIKLSFRTNKVVVGYKKVMPSNLK